jgi:hypothetical protein
MTRFVILISGAVFALATAPAAVADATASSNWAGYTIHRAGVRYTRVLGAWKQPSATCVRGRQTFSAAWVGLGGYSTTSNALEQIGTEVDCSASGQVISDAWYELVPAASRRIGLSVRPGDSMSASVSVVGKRVVVTLNNLTTHRSFHKTLRASVVDVSSAEWIVEAPSECDSAGFCQTLPLANFGSVTFTSARAQSLSGRSGTISDPAWGWTRITLLPDGRHFVVNGSGSAAGAASPSALSLGGSSFKVTYREVAVPATASQASPALPRDGYIVHAGRGL